MKKIVTTGIILILIVITSRELYTKLLFTINTEEAFISIQSGETLRDVSHKLRDGNIIYSTEAFIMYTKLKGVENNILAGNFVIPARIGFDKILIKLQKPEVEYIKFTIPEGYTIYQIAKKLEDNKLANKEEFLRISKEGLSTIEENNNSKDIIYSLEGYLFPDTYFITPEFTEEEIIGITIDRMNQVFTDEYKKRENEIGLTMNDILTIASLIEKEAANDEERGRIAGVIYNRLKKGMPLQIDASVIYGITKGQSHINRLFYKDLEYDSMYNTYKNKGLPPGPIASPGKASIEAALYPEEHDYLYYVLGKNGNGHVFSKTYSDHLKNKNKLK